MSSDDFADFLFLDHQIFLSSIRWNASSATLSSLLSFSENDKEDLRQKFLEVDHKHAMNRARLGDKIVGGVL